MRKTGRFEDLVAWQKARSMTTSIYAVTRRGEFARDFGLAGQIQRASVSVMSNIAEGYERLGPSEFAHFLSIAKGSCGEVRSQLYIALDAGYIDKNAFAELYAMAEETSRIITGLYAAVCRSRDT